MDHHPPDMQVSKSPSARVTRLEENYWHLEIPAHHRPGYHLAQLDDHGSHRRRSFPWQPPVTFSLQARLSGEDLPGTWGFGLWNDPFSLMFAYNKVVPRLPTLPHAVWFFHASAQNYLSLRDDRPANGLLAATFSSAPIPAGVQILASPVLGLSLIPATAQLVRWLLRRVVQQDSTRLQVRQSDWHTYQMDWHKDQARFSLDGNEFWQTNIAPQQRLSLVIWIDNQYAALPPKGGLKYGYLPNLEPAWLEIRDIRLQDKT